MRQWICLMLTLTLLVCAVPLGAVAQGEVSILSPSAGSFLESAEPVVITVQADTTPELTVDGTSVTNPVANANGGWDFTWTPQQAGVVKAVATTATAKDEKNFFVGATASIEIQTTTEAEQTVITPKGLDASADAAVLAFDAVFTAASETVSVKDANGSELLSLTADKAETVSVRVVLDKTASVACLYVGGRLLSTASLNDADLTALKIAGTVQNIAMRQSAEAGVLIVSPAANDKVFVGDSVTVKLKTVGMASGQTIKVTAEDGTVVTATAVDGKSDEYQAVFSNISDRFFSISAAVEGSTIQSDAVSLKLMKDTAIISENFNGGTLNEAGNLGTNWSAYLWDSAFTYQNGKDGEGLCAYNTAPTTGAWQGSGLGVNFKSASTSGKVTIEYDAYIDGKFTIRLQTTTSGSTYLDAFGFNPSGAIWDYVAKENHANAYTAKKWQKYKLVYDYEKDRIQLYIDGTLAIDDAWTSLKDCGVKNTVFAIVRADEGGVATYIDNLKVSVSQEVIKGQGGETVTGSIAYVSPAQDAVLEKDQSIIIKTEATGLDSVQFYANNTLIGTASVSAGAASIAWTPSEEGNITLKAVSGSVSQEITVDVVETEFFYSDSFDGPNIKETDKLNTWNNSQNFDEYRAGGPDGGNYGVLKGKGASKYLMINCPQPKNPGIYMVEMDIYYQSGPGSIGLSNRNDSLGQNEMFYIGPGGGYHTADTSTWTAVSDSPAAGKWTKFKYIENVDEAVRAIYLDGVLVYQGAVNQKHNTFGGLCFTMNNNWKEENEFWVDNLRVSTAPSLLIARSASVQDSNTIRLNFSKAVSMYRLEEGIKVYRGETEIPYTWSKNGKYLDLTLTGSAVGSVSTEYTVKVSDPVTAEDGKELSKAAEFIVRSPGQSANITDITWKANGGTVASLSGCKKDDTLTLSFGITGSASAARILTCVYGKNEKGVLTLKQSSVTKSMLNTGTSTAVSANLKLNADITDGDTVKVFVIDADTSVPLTDPIMIKAN